MKIPSTQPLQDKQSVTVIWKNFHWQTETQKKFLNIYFSPHFYFLIIKERFEYVMILMKENIFFLQIQMHIYKQKGAHAKIQ